MGIVSPALRDDPDSSSQSFCEWLKPVWNILLFAKLSTVGLSMLHRHRFGDIVNKGKMIQFFVNKGNGSEVVRCCSHAIVSQVLGYGSEGYAVRGTRTLRPGDSFQQNGIESGMTVRLLFRLRGGSGANNVDIPGQWQCSFCHATRCWPTRKRCYRCDTPRDFSAVDGPVRGPLGRAPLPARNNVPPTRSSGPGPGPQTVPPRILENVLHPSGLRQVLELVLFLLILGKRMMGVI